MAFSESLRRSVERQWYGTPTWLWLLSPLSPIFQVLSKLRKARQQQRAKKLDVPVIIIGNISVGGTGKTPLIISLVKYLQSQGFTPGVISRGYGGSAVNDPGKTFNVKGTTDVSVCGDEPLLIAQTTRCPVVVGHNRFACAKRLQDESRCDVILSDDGMQHYKLSRDIEIAVVDAQRGFGNGWCLPLGPLREPVKRLNDVDWLVLNGSSEQAIGRGLQTQQMVLNPRSWLNVKTGELLNLEMRPWQAGEQSQSPVALAGIGNPARFFAAVEKLGIHCENVAFNDHQNFSENDFKAFGDRPVLMTAKDAVKCSGFAKDNWWALVVEAELSSQFLDALQVKLKGLLERK